MKAIEYRTYIAVHKSMQNNGNKNKTMRKRSRHLPMQGLRWLRMVLATDALVNGMPSGFHGKAAEFQVGRKASRDATGMKLDQIHGV